MKRRLLLAAATAVALALPSVGQAATSTTTMAISATVPAACTVTATALAFGTYYTANASNGSSSITVNCTASNSVTIDLDAGAHGTLNGATTTRSMAAGASLLSYNLYQDTGHTQIWATGAGVDVTTTANLTAVVPVYGMVPASQAATPGAYTDTVNVTVTY